MEKRKIGSLLLLILVVILAVLAIVFYLRGRSPEPQPQPETTPQPTPTPTVVIQEVETIVEVQAEITAEEIRAGLNEMGRMTTAEYIFTGIASAEKPPQSILGVDLGFTAASFHASYDGVVSAGIDFGRIEVEKDGETGTVTVLLPPAEIQNVSIDLDSFHPISEQSSIFAHITPEDFNTSQVALEEKSRDRAIEMNLLEKADENARLLVQRFVYSLLGSDCIVTVVSMD